jgi:hypothetical protein
MKTTKKVRRGRPAKDSDQIKGVRLDMQTATQDAMPPLAMPEGRKDHLISARYQPPSRIRLAFADGLTGIWSFRQLELKMTNMKPTTIRVTASGTAIEVISKSGERVEIDSSSLRAMIDSAYGAELEMAFVRIRGPIEDLNATSVSLPKE